jgi:sec-independent protein translocase protein TatA
MPGNIGLPEIAIVLVIALIVFGPKRLPELGKSLGDGLREFKASISGEHDDDPPEIENGFEESPVEAEPTPVAAAKADTEAQTADPSDRS